MIYVLWLILWQIEIIVLRTLELEETEWKHHAADSYSELI